MKGIEDPEDISQIMMDVCFILLVDYVEIDKAQQLTTLDPLYKKEAPKWWNWNWRRPDLGVRRLQDDIAIKLPDGSQSKTSEIAEEIYELYIWWTTERPKRPNPFDQLYVNADGSTDTKAWQAAEAQWAKYVAEDQKMLKRLIEMRPHLWT